MNTQRSEIVATVIVALSSIIGWAFLLTELSTKLFFPTII